jgi:DNA-binding NtrC family response regulator
MSAAALQLSKVLVVDDERDLADLAEALLCHYGFQVRVAYCGNEALQILQDEDSIEAVFSDVTMPGMTGLQLAHTVRERYPTIKVVLTSGYMPSMMLAGKGKAYPYAAKPYRIETVIGLLRDERRD